MDVTEAAAALMDYRASFLAGNALAIIGGKDLSSGLRIWNLEDFGILQAAISGPGWSGHKTVKHRRAQVTADTSNRPLFTVHVGTSLKAEFRAYYVGMKQLDEAVQTTHFMLPTAGGPALMLTSQLTGCTFGVGSQASGGGCPASHIQPAGSGDGKRAPCARSRPWISGRCAWPYQANGCWRDDPGDNWRHQDLCGWQAQPRRLDIHQAD